MACSPMRYLKHCTRRHDDPGLDEHVPGMLEGDATDLWKHAAHGREVRNFRRDHRGFHDAALYVLTPATPVASWGTPVRF